MVNPHENGIIFWKILENENCGGFMSQPIIHLGIFEIIVNCEIDGGATYTLELEANYGAGTNSTFTTQSISIPGIDR